MHTATAAAHAYQYQLYRGPPYCNVSHFPLAMIPISFWTTPAAAAATTAAAHAYRLYMGASL